MHTPAALFSVDRSEPDTRQQPGSLRIATRWSPKNGKNPDIIVNQLNPLNQTWKLDFMLLARSIGEQLRDRSETVAQHK